MGGRREPRRRDRRRSRQDRLAGAEPRERPREGGQARPPDPLGAGGRTGLERGRMEPAVRQAVSVGAVSPRNHWGRITNPTDASRPPRSVAIIVTMYEPAGYGTFRWPAHWLPPERAVAFTSNVLSEAGVTKTCREARPALSVARNKT